MPSDGARGQTAIGVVCSRDLPEECLFEGERVAKVPRFARTVAAYFLRATRRGYSRSRLVGDVLCGTVEFWAATAEEARFYGDGESDSDREDSYDAGDTRRGAQGVVVGAQIDSAAALEEIVAVAPGRTPDVRNVRPRREVAAGLLFLHDHANSIYPLMADRFFDDLEPVAASGSTQVLEDPRVDCCAELLEELPRGLPVLARYPPAVLLEAAPELLREIVAAVAEDGKALQFVPEGLRQEMPAPRPGREQGGPSFQTAGGVMSLLAFDPKGPDGFLTGGPTISSGACRGPSERKRRGPGSARRVLFAR